MKKIPPTITFKPYNRFSQVVYQSIQIKRRNKTEISKNSKFYSSGAPWEFQWKKYPYDNFLTVQPIFASSKPIDSSEQEEQNLNIKSIYISLLCITVWISFKKYPQL